MKDLIEKIQKLLSLATSDNQFEAELASKKAQELLIKHNLSMVDVEKSDSDYDRTEVDLKRSVERKFVDSLLVEYYFVYSYTDRNINKVVFFGRPENLQIAMYVRSFLENSFKSLYKQENSKRGWSGKNRNAFYMGIYKGLKAQFEEQKQKMDVGNALAVINKDLRDHATKGIKVRQTTSKVATGSREALELGYDQGKNLKISKGLDGGTKNSQISLK